MSEQKKSWFHCGRCGTMFQSKPGNMEDRLCTVCGNKPAISSDARTQEEPNPNKAAPATVLPESNRHARSREKSKGSPRKKKSPHLITKLVFGWLIFMALLVFGAKKLWPKDEVPRLAESISNASPNPYLAEDRDLLANSRENIVNTFLRFVTAETEVERSQYVVSPSTIAGPMAQYNRVNTPIKINAADLSLGGSWVVHLPARKDIEVHWDHAGGGVYETVFRQENGEWALDWINFVRFTETPWPLFLAGGGNSTGEFRLLASKRGASNKDSENLKLVFHSPRLGNPKDLGQSSPEFVIPRDSENGRLLEAAFAQRESGKNPFGVTKTNMDPGGSIRVRVEIERKELPNNGREYLLKKVIACHWYSDDSSGLEPAVQTDN